MFIKEPLKIVIYDIKDLQSLVISGIRDFKEYGDVNVREKGDLLMFTYSFDCEMNNRWNFFERISRGLILNKITGEVVARPFDKFFNYGQSGHFTKEKIKCVCEKLDGSMGVLYRENGEYKISTKGSFDSDQAIWATKKLKEYTSNKPELDERYTYIFEIIYPENRVVIPYGEEKTGLHLLAIRHRITGEYPSYRTIQMVSEDYGFGLPKRYSFNNINEVIDYVEKLPFSEEGFVVRFQDDTLFKFKSPAYLKIHRLISNITEKNIAEVYATGSLTQYLTNIPDEFLEEIQGLRDIIKGKLTKVINECVDCYINAPKHSRKDFALYVNKHCKELSSYMFPLLDGKGLNVLLDIFFKREYGINTNREQKIEHLKSVGK